MKKEIKTIAITQALILLIGIFAFVWLIGGIPSVSGGDPTGSKCTAMGGTCYEFGANKKSNANSLCNEKVPGSKYAPDLCPGTTYCCVPPETPKTTPEDLIKSAIPYGLQYVPKFLTPTSMNPVAEEAGTKLTLDSETSTFWSSVGKETLNILGTAASATLGSYAFQKLGEAIGANPEWQDALGGLGGFGAAIAYMATLGSFTLAGWVVAGLALIINFFIKHTTEQGVVVYYCNQWQPSTGGGNCDLCNHQEVPCSEYQCRSLGQACNFVASDAEESGTPFCFWNNSNDINPPIIEPNPDVLNINYIYKPDNAIAPPDRGVDIVNTKSKDGCLSPFSKVTFGVKLNEPASCRISFDIRESYEDMAAYIGGSSTLKFNHTQTLVIPELNNTVGKDNFISAYVRCEDPQGNSEIGNFVFKMCVQEGPDVTPPYVESTSIFNDSQVAFNVTGAQVDFNINEPSECKWSFASGRTYENMEYNMTCVTDPTQINLRLGYTCTSNLTGIKVTDKTYYYVKCRDQPTKEINDRNTMQQDYVYALSSSRALEIIEASPNGTTISSNTDPTLVNLKAKTLGGVYDGSAVCYWSKTGIYGEYTIFDNTSSSEHSTNVYVPATNPNPQTYYIRCDDLGGNADVEIIKFNVSLDLFPPLISRAYYEEGKMKIITNEKAECEYSTSDCLFQFGDGEKVSTYDQFNHLLEWLTETTLYIKCQDIYGNQPASPNQCSIILRAESKPSA